MITFFVSLKKHLGKEVLLISVTSLLLPWIIVLKKKRGRERHFIWIIDLPISHQVPPSVKLLIRWVSWEVSRLGHHKWHFKTVTLMKRFQVLYCLILWNLFSFLQYHVFLEHTDPIYKFCGIKRTWETCHWEVLLNLFCFVTGLNQLHSWFS